MSRINREHVETLPDELLLPSQRALLALDTSGASANELNLLEGASVNRVGEILAYDMTLAALEASRQPHSDTITEDHVVRSMASMANKLLQHTPSGRHPLGTNTSVKFSTLNKYTSDDSSRSLYFGPGTYTPEGLVRSHTGQIRQRMVELAIVSTARYKPMTRTDFTTEGFLRLYTDNFSAQPPMWEYEDSNLSDMIPAVAWRPYQMHMVPRRFTTDEIALATIESIDRALDTSREAVTTRLSQL